MKYYAVINQQKNVITGWVGLAEGVQASLKEHESLHEIPQEQTESIGQGWYKFELRNGKIINLEPTEKEPTPLPMPTELEMIGQQLVNIELRLMAGGF